MINIFMLVTLYAAGIFATISLWILMIMGIGIVVQWIKESL